MLQLASVQQLHEQGHRPADLALSVFPFADRAEVVNPQHVGKPGLCEPCTLADRFEGLPVHSCAKTAATRGFPASRFGATRCQLHAVDDATTGLTGYVPTTCSHWSASSACHSRLLDHPRSPYPMFGPHCRSGSGFGLRVGYPSVSPSSLCSSSGDRGHIGPLGLSHKRNRTRFVAFSNTHKETAE